MNLLAISQLNALEQQLKDVQSVLDHCRQMFPDDGEWQYKLDIQQQHIDYERKRVMDAKSLFIPPN